MTINNHLSRFGNMFVESWHPELELQPLVAYRISIDWDEGEKGIAWVDKFYQFLESPNVENVNGLVVGAWEDVSMSDHDPSGIVEALVAASGRLKNITAIFFGDIECDESEISWIRQTDVSPILAAFPKLEHFGVRGGMDLSLTGLNHENLKTLVVETGGLEARVVAEIARANLPALEHLEIWLGSDNYGADTTVEDVKPFMEVGRFPKLKYLGLRNCEYADEIAAAIADAPILNQLETLDLSLSILTNKGAAHLINSQKIKKLKKLDLHHHFMSTDSMNKLTALGIDVDVDDQQDEDDPDEDGHVYRYIAVSE